MNAESILTGIITGVLTGGITGYFAVLHALRQFRAQRAFDRQLEWYERTVQALGAFSQVRRELHIAQTFRNPDLTMKAAEELQKGFLNVEQCINEAVLYAEQSSYEQLQEMSAKVVNDIVPGGGPRSMDSAAELFIESAAVGKVLRATLIELSRPVRKMLGLKKILLRE